MKLIGGMKTETKYSINAFACRLSPKRVIFCCIYAANCHVQALALLCTVVAWL
jgi:hypothetical protein